MLRIREERSGCHTVHQFVPDTKSDVILPDCSGPDPLHPPMGGSTSSGSGGRATAAPHDDQLQLEAVPEIQEQLLGVHEELDNLEKANLSSAIAASIAEAQALDP